MAENSEILPETVDRVAPDDGCVVRKSAYVKDVPFFNSVVNGGFVVSGTADVVIDGSKLHASNSYYKQEHLLAI